MAKPTTHKRNEAVIGWFEMYWTTCNVRRDRDLAKCRWKDVRCKACLKRKPKAKAP